MLAENRIHKRRVNYQFLVRKMIIYSTLLFFCISFPACVSKKNSYSHQDLRSESEQVSLFAEQNWADIAKKIPQGMENQFGFQSVSEIQKASLGQPIKMYHWGNNTVIDSKVYRVPVMVDQKMVSLLTVEAKDRMVLGDFGGAQLAQKIQSIADQSGVVLHGILRVYSKSSDFLIFQQNNEPVFIPISSYIQYNTDSKGITDSQSRLTLEDIRNFINN